MNFELLIENNISFMSKPRNRTVIFWIPVVEKYEISQVS